MNENNTSTLQTGRFSNIWKQFEALKQYKEQSKQNITNQNINTGFDNIKSLYDTSLTTTNPDTIKQAKNATKFSEAMMAGREEAEKHWKNWYNSEDKDVYAELRNMYPDLKEKLIAYRDDDAMDITGFKMSMGWLKDTDIINNNEDQVSDYEHQWNFLTDFFSNIMKGIAWVETLYEEKQNKINRIKQENYNAEWVDYNYDEKNSWAFAQYMYDKYGAYLSMYLNNDKRDIVEKEREYISKNPDILDRYKNKSESLLSVWEWALDTVFTVSAPIVKALLMWIWETRIGWEVLNGIWELLTLGGEQVNKLPVLKDFRDSLPTEEDQARFDALVGNIIAYKFWKKKVKEAETKINPTNIIKNFKEMKQKNPNANITDINEIAWKIVNGKNFKSQTEASNALSKTNTEWVKTYTELSERIQKSMDDNMTQQSDIYKQDTTVYKPEQTRSTVDVENAWRTTTTELRPVEDAIELLKDMYEWDTILMAWLENLIKKFNEEWLTREEINSLSQAISSKSNSYNAKNELKKTKSAQDVERIRQAVKEFARQWSEELENLDRDWSNMKNTKELVDDMSDKVLQAKQNLANRNLLQKVWWVLWTIFVKGGIKSFLWKILDKRVDPDETLNPLTRQKELNNNLQKFNKLMDKLKTATTETEVNSAVEEFNNAMALPDNSF